MSAQNLVGVKGINLAGSAFTNSAIWADVNSGGTNASSAYVGRAAGGFAQGGSFCTYQSDNNGSTVAQGITWSAGAGQPIASSGSLMTANGIHTANGIYLINAQFSGAAFVGDCNSGSSAACSSFSARAAGGHASVGALITLDSDTLGSTVWMGIYFNPSNGPVISPTGTAIQFNSLNCSRMLDASNSVPSFAVLNLPTTPGTKANGLGRAPWPLRPRLRQ